MNETAFAFGALRSTPGIFVVGYAAVLVNETAFGSLTEFSQEELK